MPPPLRGHVATAVGESVLFDQVKEIAFDERLPVQAIRLVQDDLKWQRLTIGSLAGANKHVDVRFVGDSIRG